MLPRFWRASHAFAKLRRDDPEFPARLCLTIASAHQIVHESNLRVVCE
jgi:hypothetical protein